MSTRGLYWMALAAGAALVAGAACGDDAADEADPAPQRADIHAAMGEPVPWATEAQRDSFERGRQVLTRRFTPEDGLGPQFNVTFCGACHEQPVFGGSSPRYRNFFVTAARLDDGSTVMLGKSGVQTQFSTTDPVRVPSDPRANLMVSRNAIPFFGAGALAEIPEASILASADPDDADGDGISGRPNWDRGFVGRFGRKSQTVSLEGFIRGPLFNHLGVTSNPLSNARKDALPVPSGIDSEDLQEGARAGGLAPCVNCQAAAPEEPNFDDDGVADPELAEDELFDLVSFAMLLAAPAPDAPTAQTEAGRAVFGEIGCADCHVPALEGPRGLVYAYTDLLIHDMGEGLDDGIEQGVATGREWRTAPLWGLVATGPYLHDGRADTIDEAIRWHGGEGLAARQAYVGLGDAERDQLLAFLRSLGGADQTSEGLLPPDAPVPAPGEYGGPQGELAGEAQARFERGRRLFDRDAAYADGLGPGFNGDSCRACHFDPTIGGAGPAGVNVTRQGIADAGVFYPPAGGTMAHRFDADLERRPAIDPNANVFELRQTPPLFGNGRIDQIPEEAIVAGVDPDDMDGDGISGRAHLLSNGRVGRFGWKAGFATLEDFVRDALSNEVGLTVPDQSGALAGSTTDTDAVADPEFAGQDYADLLFFTRMLAAPPRQPGDAAAIGRGEALFAQVGCTGCHTPSLPDAAGEPVALYSDLLLHDVAPDGYLGIESGQATMREFRTPPLWGLSASAPYMHDGLTPTIDGAIRRHAAEATAATAAYEALRDAERDDLLAFLRSL